MVEVFGQCIHNDIIAQVKFYSVIADKVTDAANKEELSLSLRFVFYGVVKEMFVDFLEVERITGRVLGQNILQELPTQGLSPADIRAPNMSGASVSGCNSIVQQEAPLAFKNEGHMWGRLPGLLITVYTKTYRLLANR